MNSVNQHDAPGPVVIPDRDPNEGDPYDCDEDGVVGDIEPALSSRAWREILAARDSVPVPNRDGALALAAISLHEHPQGFTWHDADILNDMAAGMEMDISFPDGMSEERSTLAAESIRKRATDLRNLAQRIGALLAPRV